jgi:hypothetical protein
MVIRKKLLCRFGYLIYKLSRFAKKENPPEGEKSF